MPNYDGAIIQHELTFFGDTFESTFGNFAETLREVAASEKPTALFLHTDMPNIPKRPVLRPWSPAARVRSRRREMIHAMYAPHVHAFTHREDSRARWIGYGVSADRMGAIVFPVPPAGPIVEPRPLSADDTVELLIFGFIAEYKGYEVALEAMGALPENFVLTIAGEPSPVIANDQTLDAIYGFLHTGKWVTASTFRRVRRRMLRPFGDDERQSLQRRVRIVGYVPPAASAEVMARADIVLLPYRFGPSGSSALCFAIAHARPIIASSVESSVNIAQRSDCVRLVAVDAPFQLAETIRAVAADLAERQRLARACTAFAAANNFDILGQHCVNHLQASVLLPADQERNKGAPGLIEP